MWHTNTDPRYVREWLSSQAAGGYVAYDADTDRFSLTAEQAFTLEARMRDVVTSAGFSKFRRATETPFNLIYEARL